MEKSQDDTETPRSLIEHMVGHSAAEETVVAPRKRKFFRTPKEKRRLSTSATDRNDRAVKRRHVSGSESLHSAKKSKQNELAESSFTPRTLIEQMTGDGNSAEQSVRVEARVTRAKSNASVEINSTLNVSHHRSTRSSLRKKVAMKQLIKNNTDEATPRGLIEGLIAQGDESMSIRVDPETAHNKTEIADFDLKKRRRMSSLGESFFISSSAPEPRHLQARKSSKRGVDPQKFAAQVDDKVESMREQEDSEGEISATTKIVQDIQHSSAQYDKTEELKRVLSSRRVSAVTPAVTPTVGSFHIDDTIPASETSLERTVDYTGRTRQSTSIATDQSANAEASPRRRSSPRKKASKTTSLEGSAIESIADRLSRRKSRENVVTLENSHRSLPQNAVVDDDNDKAGDVESQEAEEDSSENEESDDNEDADEADDEQSPETVEQDQEQYPEREQDSEQEQDQEQYEEMDKDRMTYESQEVGQDDENTIDNGTKAISPGNIEKEHDFVPDKDCVGQEENNTEVQLHRTVDVQQSRRSTLGRRSSTRNRSSIGDGSSVASEVTRNNSTDMSGFDPMQTPQINTPAMQRKRSPLPSTSKTAQPAKPVAAVKPTTRRTTKKGPKDEAAARRIPRSITKSIFAHFTSLGFSKDTLAAVEKISDKFWMNMIGDLNAYAAHARRMTIEQADVELLMKRQGFITDKQSLHTLIEKWLPLEYRQELIPIARAGNRLVPKPKK